MIDVELRHHSGITARRTEQFFPLDRVFVDGRDVGFIGHQPGAKFCPIRELSEAELHAVLEAIKVGERTQQADTENVAKLPEGV